MAVTPFQNGYTLAAAGDAVNLGSRAILKIGVEKGASAGTVTLTDGTTTIFVTASLAATGTAGSVAYIDTPRGFAPGIIVFSAVSAGAATVRVYCEPATPGGFQANVTT